MADIIKFAISKTPLLISTTIHHYLNGPPRPSWNLKFHLNIELYKSTPNDNAQTIEQAQALINRPIPVPAGMMINESKIDNKYRYEAQVHLDKILKPYEHVLDAEWKDLKEDGIDAEWVQVPDDGWEKREIRKTILYLHGGGYYLCSMKGFHRNLTSKIAKQANARVFAIDYRLAPQNQFPAGLQDAFAAYLYLLNPPKDAGFEPLNPKNIVFSGDSSGGGLSVALGLALRDAGLPSCAGIVALSPWFDLTLSMPSMTNDKSIDYVPNPVLTFQHANYPYAASSFAESQVLIDYNEKAAALTARIKKQNLGPKIWHDSFDIPEGRLHMYVPNEGLAIPYVSPMLAESLGNLPPLLLIAGGEERLCDEIIYFAHKSAEPAKYKGPSYNAGKFEKTSFQTPTNVTLEIYEEMPHVFQVFEHHVNAVISYERIFEFIDRVMNTSNELPSSSYNRINGKGEFGPLNEHDEEILKWEKIGIVPNVTRSEINTDCHVSKDSSFYASLRTGPSSQDQILRTKLPNERLENCSITEWKEPNKENVDIDNSALISFLEVIKKDYQNCGLHFRTTFYKFVERYNMVKLISISRLSSFLYSIDCNVDVSRVKSGAMIRVQVKRPKLEGSNGIKRKLPVDTSGSEGKENSDPHVIPSRKKKKVGKKEHNLSKNIGRNRPN